MRQEVLYATLSFLYTDDYDDDRPPQADETRSCDLNVLIHNYAVDINLPALTKLSLRKYESCASRHWNSAEFTNSLAVIYSRYAEDRVELRATVVKVFEEHGEKIFNQNTYLSSLVKTRPLFGQDIAPILFDVLERRQEAERCNLREQTTLVDEKVTECARGIKLLVVEKPGITDEEKRQRLLKRKFVENNVDDDAASESEESDEDVGPVVRRGRRKRCARNMGNFVSWGQLAKDYFD
jgi:hypothetical protein